MEGVKITSTFNAIPENLPSKKPTLNDYSWEEIKRISDLQLWNLYGFKDGDKKTVNITGSASGVDLTGSWDCFILGFNHNESLEGTGITFQFAKKDNKDIAFQGFKMNNSELSSGGWELSKLRTEICAQFLNLLPEDLKTTIKETNKFTDNTGNGNGDNANFITLTKDKIFIISEFEALGVKKNANLYEKNYQMQYSYYKVGNSKIKYQHISLSKTAVWWMRSPCSNERNAFCIINGTGNSAYAGASSERGFCPCFVI